MHDALAAMITGDTDSVTTCFAEDVAGWMPNLVVTSRAELLDAVAGPEDSLTDVDLLIDSIDVIGAKVIAEWRVSAMFTGAFLLDDDILVEPNGHQVVLGGITVAEFCGGKIQTFRAYFDEVALLEQMMETA
jgi:ketosteroid isomerase-like protein